MKVYHFLQSVNIFYDCCVNIILVLAHLYLHGSRVCGDFHVTEVVKEENNAKPDPYGVCDLQNREMSGGLSCDLCVDTGKSAPTSTSLLKVMMENPAPKKVARPTNRILIHSHRIPGPGLFLKVMIKLASPRVVISRSGSFSGFPGSGP